MADQGSFWQRLGSALRPGENSPNKPPRDEQEPHKDASSTVLDIATDTRRIPWWRRRQVRQAQSREVAIRMVDLADAMQTHFERQDERTAEVSGALDRVGTILEQLAESQRTQGEYLSKIADHTENAGRQSAQLSETLARVPDSLMTQAEAIRTVARQVEVAQEADTQLMHSLQQFSQTVGTLGDSGTAQAEILQKLNDAHRDQHESLTNLVREQSRRFVLIMVLASVVVLAGLGALTVTVIYNLQSLP